MLGFQTDCISSFVRNAASQRLRDDTSPPNGICEDTRTAALSYLRQPLQYQQFRFFVNSRVYIRKQISLSTDSLVNALILRWLLLPSATGLIIEAVRV
jgi:hypothetical protein